MRSVFAVTVLVAVPAVAQESSLQTRYAVDGAITAAAFAGAVLLELVPVDETHTWSSEPFGFDESVKDNFSSQAAALSDSLVLLTVVSPLMAQTGFGFEEPTGQAALIYAETIAGGSLLATIAKITVQRPRPYVYNSAEEVLRFAVEQGRESRLSFFSGHSTVAFAAAVSGCTLFAARSEDRAARATLWGVELALAAATAGLRVRAGRHFISDVVLGSLVGTALGIGVPILHLHGRGTYAPRVEEWAAMAGGLVAGGLFAVLTPFDNTAPVSLAPMPVENGSGLTLVGSF